MMPRSIKHRRRDNHRGVLARCWYDSQQKAELKARKAVDAFKAQLDDPYEPRPTPKISPIVVHRMDTFVWERDIRDVERGKYRYLDSPRRS